MYEEAGVRKGRMKLEEATERREREKCGTEKRMGRERVSEREKEEEKEKERARRRGSVGTYVLLYFATVIFINQRYSTTSRDVEGWNL